MFSVFIYIILAIFLLLTFWLFFITLSKRVLKCFIIKEEKRKKFMAKRNAKNENRRFEIKREPFLVLFLHTDLRSDDNRSSVFISIIFC